MKILLIRLSSIGDIVLCSPVIRWLKTQIEALELHFLTKESFLPTVAANPYLDKIHLYKPEDGNFLPSLQVEGFDYVIDLHNNWRTWRIRGKIGGKVINYSKLNLKKWLLCRVKINLLPKIHLIDRYLQPLQAELKIKDDGLGLDFFIKPSDQPDLAQYGLVPNQYVSIAVGAAHPTKQIPAEKIAWLCQQLADYPLVLLGGKNEQDLAEQIQALAPNVQLINLCGRLNLGQSAAIVAQAGWVIAPDTGLMHIAAAFKKPLISVWGSTVPDFGMYPYYPEAQKGRFHIVENQSVRCRPCSKLGYARCPKKHFDCMQKNQYGQIVELIKNNL